VRAEARAATPRRRAPISPGTGLIPGSEDTAENPTRTLREFEALLLLAFGNGPGGEAEKWPSFYLPMSILLAAHR